jgi:hypothetical protein
MIVSKTLSSTVAGAIYPATYLWTTTCGKGSGLNFSDITGTINNDTVQSTTISYDDQGCLECDFSLKVTSNNDPTCTETTTTHLLLTCGTITFINNSSNLCSITLLSTSTACSVINGVCTVPNTLFGNYIAEILVDCPSNNATLIINDSNGTNTQTVTNNTYYLNISNSFSTPNISVQINCN